MATTREMPTTTARRRPDDSTPPARALRRAGASRWQNDDARWSDLLGEQARILELLARGAPLATILERVAICLELFSGHGLCTAWLLSDDSRRLRRILARGLPSHALDAVREIALADKTNAVALAANQLTEQVVAEPAATAVPAPPRARIAPTAAASWAQPIVQHDGELLGVFAVHFDTLRQPTADERHVVAALMPLMQIALERDRQSRRRRAVEARFSALVANIPGVVYQRVVEPDGRIHYTYISPGVEALFGVTPEEVLADSNALFRRHAPDYAATFRERLLAASRELKLWDVDATIITRTGEKKMTHAIARPTRRPDGAVVWDGVILDPTRIKQVELVNLKAARDAAEAANRAKTAFLANMSHELRTPLNAVIGFAELMANEVLGPVGHPKYAEYVRDILSSGSHLLNLIEDLLDLARIEHGKLALNESTVSLTELIDVCVRMVETRAIEGRLDLRVETAGTSPTLRVDELRMKQVLLNLLTNAVKFTPAGGTITVRGRLAGDGTVAIEVQDTGIGMNPAAIPRALQPFQQLENGDQRRRDGAGLGLALCTALIDLHGGMIALDSTPGVGTKVTLTLPASRVMRA